MVFALASLSFGCLIGQFYGWWSMRVVGDWGLPPATAWLGYTAWRHREQPRSLTNPHTWIVHGSVGGLLAAFAYDLYRLPFVLRGEALFNVFPRFGELLLGSSGPRWAILAVGWTYHFSNGAALGIMFLVLAGGCRRLPLLWGAVGWALFVEAMLLLTPYAAFFGLPLNGRFMFLTASAHLVFGVALGSYLRTMLPRTGDRRRPNSEKAN
ncbi:MAG: hypothetical protein KGS61_18030 [Verrucomicrobia bacterium]|nr:hypothetical protein [Verrucomicrobiota bacterium]